MIGCLSEHDSEETPVIENSTPGASGPELGIMARLAARVGCTEGQLYTMIIGLILAIVLAVACIPKSIRHHHLASATVGVAHIVTSSS